MSDYDNMVRWYMWTLFLAGIVAGLCIAGVVALFVWLVLT